MTRPQSNFSRTRKVLNLTALLTQLALATTALTLLGCSAQGVLPTAQPPADAAIDRFQVQPGGRVSPPVEHSCRKGDDSGSAATDLTRDVSPAVTQDAQSYADDVGVELDEAIVRLQGQGMIGRLGAEIETLEPATYGGHWIQHEPQYRMVVLFTRESETTICPYIEGRPMFDIVQVRSAEATYLELKNSQEEATKVVREAGIQAESGINVYRNLVELYVKEPAELDSALQQAGLTLPDHVEVIQVAAFSLPGQ